MQESKFRQQLEEKDTQIQSQEIQIEELRKKLEEALGEVATLKNREMQQAQPLQPHVQGTSRMLKRINNTMCTSFYVLHL